MKRKERTLLLAAILLSPGGIALADHKADTSKVDTDEVDEITVVGDRLSAEWATIAVQQLPVVDTADALSRLPGADSNMNGRLTGIAQYRGMFGDRVAVSIDGIGVISGGPNAMDTPLSYVSPMITEALTVERGVTSVASAPDAIGGHINARLARGAFGATREFGLSGTAGVRYADNGDTSTSALRVTAANDRHRVSLVGQLDRGDDLDTPAGRILPSEVSRDRYDLSYGFQDERTDLLVFAGVLNTDNTGTAALPMDIDYIDTALYGLRLKRDVTADVSLTMRLGYNDVEHGMNNFQLRTPPPSPMRFRENTTRGDGLVYAFSAEFTLGERTLVAGVDGRTANHDARITNPNNGAFFITAFNDVERDVHSGFVALRQSTAASDWEFGMRYNHVATNAGEVGSGGMMGMMGMNAERLAAEFNAADRDLRFDNVDVVAKFARRVSPDLTLTVDVGTKTRAPSYQELYLWLPLSATGGLADGRNYLGNLQLDAERSVEIVAGAEWATNRVRFSPQVYFRDISDYIQGVPSTSEPGNAAATMMTGQPALEFANVDAEIYGFDLGFEAEIGQRVRVDGGLAYTRGRRTDVADNLYRLPPLNGLVGLNYIAATWTVRGEVVAFARQDDVSEFNDEQPTAGYAIVNGMLTWNPVGRARLEFRAENLFDRGYQNHLAGINRVNDVDLPRGTRLYGAGRTLVLGASIDF